jgi:ech hydrogenase subunit F
MAFFEMARIAMGTLFRSPATRKYPAVAAKKTPLSRGHVTIDESRCISCKICMKKCPAEAICVDKEAKTWTIDRLRCVVCNCCVEVCPVHCLFMDTTYSPALTEHGGIESITITYIKPERPPKKETAEEGSG